MVNRPIGWLVGRLVSSVGRSISLVGPPIGQSLGWCIRLLACWLADWSVGRSVGLSISRWVDSSVSLSLKSLGRSANLKLSVDRSVGRSVGRSVCGIWGILVYPSGFRTDKPQVCRSIERRRSERGESASGRVRENCPVSKCPGRSPLAVKNAVRPSGPLRVSGRIESRRGVMLGGRPRCRARRQS